MVIINGRYASEGGGLKILEMRVQSMGGLWLTSAQTFSNLFFNVLTEGAVIYLECGNQISPKSSPLQGMKAQPLQSLFVDKLTNVPYQP